MNNFDRYINMFEELSRYLNIDLSGLDFTDNVYNSESFFQYSIRNDFAGWYNSEEIVKQIDFILCNCLIDQQDSILDAACGHGKHSFELASRGYKVFGIDISDALISHLNNKENHGASFYRCRISELQEAGKYSLVMVLGNSISLMPIEECKKSLKKIHSATKAGGHVFFQIDNKREFIAKEANTRNWDFHQKRWLNISEHYFDPKRSLELTREIGFDLLEKKVDQFVLVKRLYDVNEFIGIIKSTGFTEIEYWGDWDKSIFVEESPTLLLKAKKE